MALDYIHGPAFKLRYRDAQRAVLNRAEAVADGRRSGSLSAAAIDRLVDAQGDLDRLRRLYLSGADESATQTS